MIDRAELSNVFGLSAAVTAASRAGLLVALVERPASAEDYARALALSLRATRLVLDVLVAFGLATRNGERFEAAQALTEAADGPFDLAQMASLWCHAPEFLATGDPFLRMDGDLEQREALYADVVPGLGRMFAPAARELASRLERAPARVLDVGCGSGVWSLALAERFEGTRVTGLDLSDVLPAFEARAAELGLAQRVETLPGNMHSVDIPNGAFDLVMIANVLRIEEPDRAAQLVHRAARAIVPGGRMIVVDAFGDGSPVSGKNLSVYAMHLAMRTSRGRVHSARDVQAWMSAAGLSEPREIRLDAGLGPVGAIVAG